MKSCDDFLFTFKMVGEDDCGKIISGRKRVIAEDEKEAREKAIKQMVGLNKARIIATLSIIPN